MNLDPQNHLRLHYLEHQRRLERAQMLQVARKLPRQPSRKLMKLGGALVALGKRIQAQATQDARRTSAEHTVTLTNELHKL